MQIACPSCKRQLRIADSAAGKKVKCPACGTSFTALDQVEELVEPGPPPPKPKRKVDVVETVEEAPPPRPRRDRDDDDYDRPRRPRDRDDYDDDDDDRRRRDRRDDDYDRPRRSRRRGSGAGSITGVGVITIILGSLSLLCGVCVMIGGIAGAGAAGGRFGPNVMPFGQGAIASIAIAIALVILILGVLYLIGGIGVLQRRNWGRIVTLVSAGFSGVAGVFLVLSFIGNLISPMPMEAKIMPVLVALLGALVCFAHCIMSFIVLLNSDNAREFR